VTQPGGPESPASRGSNDTGLATGRVARFVSGPASPPVVNGAAPLVGPLTSIARPCRPETVEPRAGWSAFAWMTVNLPRRCAAATATSRPAKPLRQCTPRRTRRQHSPRCKGEVPPGRAPTSAGHSVAVATSCPTSPVSSGPLPGRQTQLSTSPAKGGVQPLRINLGHHGVEVHEPELTLVVAPLLVKPPRYCWLHDWMGVGRRQCTVCATRRRRIPGPVAHLHPLASLILFTLSLARW
jgi:hypothetical protein